MQDSVEVPDGPSVTLVGLIVQVTPADGKTTSVKVTVPVNPWRGVTTMVDDPSDPALTETDVGLVMMPKSWIA